jgi:hypothetical protein
MTVIDEERLARWYSAAGLTLTESRRLPGRPFPIIVQLAVRAGEDAVAADGEEVA